MRHLVQMQVVRPLSVRLLSTSALRCAQAQKKQRKTANREADSLDRQMAALFEVANPFTGYNARRPDVWTSSLVKQSIVTPQQVWGTQQDTLMGESQQEGISAAGEVAEARKVEAQYAEFPQRLNFGLTPEDVAHVTKNLPLGVAWESALTSETVVSDLDNRRKAMASAQEISASEVLLLRILDLRNADAKAIHAYNRHNLVRLFRHHDNDTASPEVVSALYTGDIFALLHHISRNRHDINAANKLRRKVNLRRHTLLYLLRKSPIRFNEVLPKLGMLPSSVQGEQRLTRDALKEALSLVDSGVH